MGGLYLALSLLMLSPVLVAGGPTAPDAASFVLSSVIASTLGALLMFAGRGRSHRELRTREAILLVVLSWLSTCLLGALPFWFSAEYSSFTNALFESTSGFTTTGATVIADVDSLSRPIQFWRAISHWIGGMGIILLGLAVLPLLGQGGNALYRAEFSGSSTERLRPRVLEIARSLWRIYLALTLAEILLLMMAGMGAFDAVCHAFSTLGTGGFSTRTASVGGFDSALIETIILLFMLLAGISFANHFRLLVELNTGAFLRDREIRAYLGIAIGAAVAITLVLMSHDQGDKDWSSTLRIALFQTISILTTTGFSTAGHGQWPPAAQVLLVLLMFAGGCTGSTAGGLKVARIDLLIRIVGREFRRFIEPMGVFRVHAGGHAVAEQTLFSLMAMITLSFLTLSVGSLILSLDGLDLITAASAVLACQFNVGPGLGAVGPAENFGHLSDLAKWTLSLCMLAGRLEFYTFLIIFTRPFWRR